MSSRSHWHLTQRAHNHRPARESLHKREYGGSLTLSNLWNVLGHAEILKTG